jgi:hypothetical protein
LEAGFFGVRTAFANLHPADVNSEMSSPESFIESFQRLSGLGSGKQAKSSFV